MLVAYRHSPPKSLSRGETAGEKAALSQPCQCYRTQYFYSFSFSSCSLDFFSFFFFQTFGKCYTNLAVLLSLHSGREVKFPSRCYSLRREWEIGLVCPANLSLACGKVLPASKWSSKTSSAGNREICGKSEKRNKNFNKWIMSNCCHAIWSPEPSNLCLILLIYNVHVLSFYDPWLWGHFVQVIGNLELRGSRKKDNLVFLE